MLKEINDVRLLVWLILKRLSRCTPFVCPFAFGILAINFYWDRGVEWRLGGVVSVRGLIIVYKYCN